MPPGLAALLPHITATLLVAADAWATVHVVLTKRDVRAAIGWIGVIWMVPVVGPGLYALLGINRIQRKAQKLRGAMTRYRSSAGVQPLDADSVRGVLPDTHHHLDELARVMDRIASRPLLPGNRVTPLANGDEAYPAMLAAIDAARHSVSLVTYIFDVDQVGRQFIAALGRARQRGVDVRVLIDTAGVRYSREPAPRALRLVDVNVAQFMPLWVPWLAPYLNLRQHRKIMVVDGRIGFAGGMNIREGHQLELQTDYPVQDVQFQVEGPVVAHLQQVFAEDWQYTTGQPVEGEAWFPLLGPVGRTVARGIADGPDEDIDKVPWTYMAGIAAAEHKVRIVTPYFLPDEALDDALGVASMRGIDVELCIPETTNIRLIQWAMRAHLGELLERGVRVWLVPAPFDHAKMMIVDDAWVLMGSANWDARSLRLNFEFQVECYDAVLAERVGRLVEDRIRRARALTLDELNQRSLPVRLRDSLARLASPYL